MSKTSDKVLDQNLNDEPERITIIVPDLSQAAVEIHRRNMWERGYRLENAIQQQKYLTTEGHELKELFDGQLMCAATFVRR